MQATPEEIQRQVSERAKYAASVAVASGSVVESSFIAVVTGGNTVGQKAVVFGALAGFASFFLPWIAPFGLVSASGLRAALDASWVFWLHPASMITCFLLSAFNMNAGASKRVLAARWYIVFGTLWLLPGLAALCNLLLGIVGFGGYLATGSAGAILLGGVIQVSENVFDGADRQQGVKVPYTPLATPRLPSSAA